MSAHSLSIAKAALLASCLRPDPTKLTRDDLTDFHSLLEASIIRCTPSNIQTTKAWLLQHILSSSLRTSAWCKYLASLSKNIDSISGERSACRPCRRQLHLLYLIHDILHHTKYHLDGLVVNRQVEEHISNILPKLIANANADGKRRTTIRLTNLVEIWEHASYFSSDGLLSLRNALTSGTSNEVIQVSGADARTTKKELPWIMPATHGDAAAPFFDLPAANLMPHIVPNSAQSIRPDDIRALQLQAGQPDEGLVNALKDFLKDIQSIEDPYTAAENEGFVPDIDEMGQVNYMNELDEPIGDTYYGWSKPFCEKMKARAKGGDRYNRGRSRSSYSSESRSRSRTRSPHKRRRYSSSRSRSRSSRRTGSLPRFTTVTKKDDPSPAPFKSLPSDSRPRFGISPQSVPIAQLPPPPPPLQSPQRTTPSFMPSFRPPPMGQNGMPLLPPKPPNWVGPWPPPPPPPPGAHIPYPPPQNFGHPSHARR